MKLKTKWLYLKIGLITLALLPITWQCSEQPEQLNDNPLATPAAVEKASLNTEFDTPPQPEGGFAAIARNLKYPQIARKAGIEGKVFLEIEINEKGIIGAVDVVRVDSESLEMSGCTQAAENAIRAVSWKPATKDGVPIKVKVVVPVNFKLS